MNLGRGFPVPQEKLITQNGNFWIPATPEKPVVQRPSYSQAEMQQNQTGRENWQDLLGIYTGLLQDEPDNGPPKKVNLNTHVGPNHREPSSHDVTPVLTSSTLSQNFITNGQVEQNHREPSNGYGVISPNFHENGVISSNYHQNRDISLNFHQNGVISQNFFQNRVISPNFREHNIHNVAPVENFRSLNQKAGSIGPDVQNLGRAMPPQKVNSLAELLGGIHGSVHASQKNCEARINTYIMEKQTNIRQPSKVESRQSTYKSAGALLQQNHSLQANHSIGDYNLPQMTNSHDASFAVRPTVSLRPDYNLNFPPRSGDGESSSALRLLNQILPVVPDVQKQSMNYQIIQEPALQVEEIPNQEEGMSGDGIFSQQPEIVEKDSNEFVQTTLGTSSISTPSKEHNNFDGQNEVGIDLNKTPPQKTPKRKKHRPKVVVEGKQKRTRKKPAVAKNNTPDGTPREKRKYVRRKGIKTSTPPPDVVKEVEVYKVDPAAKSCRRSLNFDLKNSLEKESQCSDSDYQAQNNEGNGVPIDLNLASNGTKWSAEIYEPSTLAHGAHQDIDSRDKQHTDKLYNRVHSAKQIPCQESVPPTDQTSVSKGHTLNAIARSLSFRNANIEQSGGENRYYPVQHRLGGGLPHIVIREPNLDGRRQLMLNSKPQLLEASLNFTAKQGSQRGNSYSELAQPQSVTLMGSQLWSNGISKKDEYTGCSRTAWKNCSEYIKKSSVEGKFPGISSGTHSETMTVGDCSGLTKNRGDQSFTAQSSSLCTSSNPGANKAADDWYFNSAKLRYKLQQQNASSQVHQCAEILGQKTSSHCPSTMQSTISVRTITNCYQESASGRHPNFTQGNEIVQAPVRVIESQTEQAPPSEIFTVDRVPQKEIKNSRGPGRFSKTVKGSRGKKKMSTLVDDITDCLSYSVDDIINCLKGLSIEYTGKEIVRREQNALVPYRGDGVIVPYEAFNPIKRRQPRPKVDLDPETSRLWNLLMGKEGSGCAEAEDTDKQKWWEEERKVFRGRVDSFIARMHLVQGDRRFSKWKGSVVDSCIGVFLTQNVSDHLSSSAFMSLAAKFPIKSGTSQPECSQTGETQSGERHKVRVTFPYGTTTYDPRITREPVCIDSSVTFGGSAQSRADNSMRETRSHIENDHYRTEEDIISSQSSLDSFIFQASEDIRSSSGSNSEAEDQLMARNFNLNHGPLNLAEQAKRTCMYQQQQFQVMGSSFPDNRPLIDQQPLEKPLYGKHPGAYSGRNVNYYQFNSNWSDPVISPSRSWLSMLTSPEKCDEDVIVFSGKEGVSSLGSTDFGSTTGIVVECGQNKAGKTSETSYTAQRIERPKSQASLAHRGIVNKYIGQHIVSQSASLGRNAQHFINTFLKESKFLSDPTRPAESSSKQPSGGVPKYTGQNFDNQVKTVAHSLEQSENVTPKPNEMGQLHSSGGASSNIGTATPNGRKRKAEKEVEPLNWDILREQVHSKFGNRGRNMNAMDSLDYEALRNADVREISDAIKERGMNNMLAERIKDFLNRLIQDHGRVDLEWLRDVQPDKAKDYLLSIRGLGLKSVECVRLLTLHHLAFPVDTNVGRIAVRLGWVPLQPLPESLQLHLLEMYPVLESIQKYLWPRLCKLDQETLYELHYQMITFGKVFCTKREPNCNACPLRAECRHFASAFASARLALPGPEEKHIVTSADPISAKRGPEVTIRPASLLQAGDNLEGQIGFSRNCEPIIEEPSTPEAFTELLERDIEDAFYEDPDEIPVIKLNLEDFTTNLQSFMQEHMEMQEGDMSRALVAISPELASIPMPKLKHVSRLRTEHQVYELPDSHPLLKGMDRREPDDPSPYLLAIWTPGETADSIQPPESKCSSQEGGPCSLSTCFSCNSTREANAQTVRGTILIPCRTAMRGSFPLNGTYFQVNELFADHESSLNPIDVPRSWLWNLSRRTVFFGTSVSTIFKGLSTQDIQICFWKGFVCVRGFDREFRTPRPLKARLHFPASKMVKPNEQRKNNAARQV